MLPIFLISLENRAPRREKVLSKLKELGINDVTWFHAVNGNEEDLSKYNIDRTRLQRFWHNKISCCSYNRSYSNGEYGCALSHLKLYEKIVNEDIDVAFIIEDDVYLKNQDVADFISNLDEAREKTGFDILFLDHDDRLNTFNKALLKFGNIDLQRIGVPGWDWLFNRRKTVYKTSAYIITKKGAQRLLDIGYPVRMPADVLTGLIAYNKLNAWKTVPKAIIDTGDPSELIHAQQLAENKKSWIQRNLTLKAIKRRLFK